MLSTRLVELIETHWEEIGGRLIRAIRSHPEMPHLASCPDMELREWCQEILEHLGYLLAASKEEDVKRRFEILGRLRYEENIPLSEAVLRCHLLNDKIIGFVHEQGFPLTMLQLYAEEELEHRMSRFFDSVVYYLVRGYEQARSVAQRVAAM